MKISIIINYVIIFLFIPVLFSTIVGGCEINSYIKRTNSFYKEPVKLGYLKIDSISSFSNSLSINPYYYGHGYIIKDSTIRKVVSLNKLDNKKGYWKQYLEENNNLLPVWYNKHFLKINIPPKKNKKEVIAKIKKSRHKFMTLFFTPLPIYILFILGYKYITKKWPAIKT